MDVVSSDPVRREEFDQPAVDAVVPEDLAGGQPWRWPAVAAAVVCSWLVGGLKSFTLSSNIAVFVIGALFLAVAFIRPPRRLPLGRPVTKLAVVWWLAALGALTVIP